ncbi:MlaD family protein [Rhodococcus sp. USK13]|uniref:MlaD family protein n=1 Tax=Rhodococcus sp. USK13 TaxID=2806442 RepID=UPI001BD007CD|nr:MlaD family protein [Rhodococcus sp. USK13]
MSHAKRWKRGFGAITLGLAVGLTTSCSLGPKDLPSVQGGVRDGYAITMQFASALNLPDGAHVTLNGLRVGQVGAVDVQGPVVVVTVNVAGDARIPTDVHGVIRQDTLLGDTYIALETNQNTTQSEYLKPGMLIPAAQTTSPPQLEDTMAVLAYFVNGGSIQKVQDTMKRLNNVMPPQQDVRAIASTVAVDLRDLSDNLSEIDRTLDGMNATAVAMDNKSDALSVMFEGDENHTGTYYWRSLNQRFIGHLSVVLPNVGSVFEGGQWLVPMLNSIADAGQSIRNVWDEGPTSAEKVDNFIRTTLLPFAKDPQVNIKSIQAANGDQVLVDVENILRMLGAVK